MLLVGLAVFVSAYTETIDGDEDNIVYTASAFQGWNIMNGGLYTLSQITEESDIQPEDISAIFYYSPSKKAYIRIHPNLEDAKFQSEEDYYGPDRSLMYSSAVWVYVKRDGMIQYRTDDIISMTKRDLTSGWNFVSVTQNALGSSLNELKGTCNIQKAYYYFKEYNQLDLNMKLPNDMASHGLLIKVSDDCSFSLSNSNGGVAPPQIPDNDDSVTQNTGVRKDIEDYYYNEFSYEECELNGAKEYTSVADCKSAWRCLAGEYAKLIPESDLQDLKNYMEEHGGESGSIYYANKNPSVNSQLTTKYNTCLAGRHNDY